MPKVRKQSAKRVVRKKVAVGGIAGRISPMGFEDKNWLKILLYGKSGTGKTTLWGTFPGKILAIICSGGKNPGELRSLDTPENRKRIDQVVVKSSSDIQEVVGYQNETGKYATIVLDHGSGLQDQVLKEILGLEKIPEQLSWGLASQQDYGKVALQVKGRLRSLLDLECNVVIIAQERDFNTETNSDLILPFVAAAFSPSIVGWLNPACDFVCQTFIRRKMEEKQIKLAGKTVTQTVRGEGVEYCLRTAPHDVFTTKFRVPKGTPLPEVIVDPSYRKIIDLIQGKG